MFCPPAEKKSFGLGRLFIDGFYCEVDELNTVRIISHECGAAVRECARLLIGCYV